MTVSPVAVQTHAEEGARDPGAVVGRTEPGAGLTVRRVLGTQHRLVASQGGGRISARPGARAMLTAAPVRSRVVRARRGEIR
jgi:hypothetical protein